MNLQSKSFGSIYYKILKIQKRSSIGKINPESEIHSDKWRGYNGLVDVGYNKHYRINHSKWFVKKNIHINGIESFWSFTKRRLAKFNGVKRYFDLHLKECEWRWNKNHLELESELDKIIKNSNFF